jgi:hypothetical protein
MGVIFNSLIIIACSSSVSSFIQSSNPLRGIQGTRAKVYQLDMKQPTYKAAWWKTAIASLGIVSGTLAAAPMDSFAADTVKV